MIFKNVKIVLENKIINNGFIEIKNKEILSIGEGDYNNKNAIDLNGLIAMPGYIDLHTHGYYGVGFKYSNVEFKNGAIDSFKYLCAHIGKTGVTKFVLASTTLSDKEYEPRMKVFGEFMSSQNDGFIGSRCLGLHFEGPFISSGYAKPHHNEELLLKPDYQLIEKYQKLTNNNIKIITFAPELQDGSFINYCLSKNILPSVGHSSASVQDLKKGYELGLKHVAHLFKDMDGNVEEFALSRKDVVAELLADFNQLSAQQIKSAIKKGPEKLCIITDGSAYSGLEDGIYKIGNMDVIKDGTKLLTTEGKFLSSTSSFDINVKLLYQNIQSLSLIDIAKMTSSTAAKELGIFDQTGSLEEGKMADIVFVDEELNVKLTISEGQVVYGGEITK